jgi:hypothetical protein
MGQQLQAISSSLKQLREQHQQPQPQQDQKQLMDQLIALLNQVWWQLCLSQLRSS